LKRSGVKPPRKGRDDQDLKKLLVVRRGLCKLRIRLGKKKGTNLSKNSRWRHYYGLRARITKKAASTKKAAGTLTGGKARKKAGTKEGTTVTKV